MTTELPSPLVKPVHRGKFSLVWLVPIVALLASGVLVIRTYLGNGPKIHITFETAEGLEAGKSEVRYRNVVVGKVIGIDILPDRLHIVATVQLTHGAAGLAVEDTRFWVERPRVGLTGISGVGTLFSGAYINVDIGSSKDDEREFVGLEKPPGVLSHEHGRTFKLMAPDAGSLSVRSPVYFRKIAVGLVSSVELAKDGHQVEIEVFVESPYDRNVTEHTVFWNAGGVDLTVGADGLKLDTQSLATVLAGGIAFQVRAPVSPDPIAKDNQLFPLYDDRVAAFKTPDGPSLLARMRFKQSVRGLVIGTPIDFAGITVGNVNSVALDYDASTHQFVGNITADVYPERLGAAYTGLLAADPKHAQSAADVLQGLVEHGLRAQTRSASLLTGQSYIAWDFFPKAKPAAFVAEPGVVVVPTEIGASDDIQSKVQDIVGKLDAIPFADIGANLKQASASAGAMLTTIDHNVAALAPEARKMFADAQKTIASLHDDLLAPDSPIQDSARTTLEQIKRAAYSLRTLADYLSQHPESLVRGRAETKEPSR